MHCLYECHEEKARICPQLIADEGLLNWQCMAINISPGTHVRVSTPIYTSLPCSQVWENRQQCWCFGSNILIPTHTVAEHGHLGVFSDKVTIDSIGRCHQELLLFTCEFGHHRHSSLYSVWCCVCVNIEWTTVWHFSHHNRYHIRGNKM